MSFRKEIKWSWFGVSESTATFPSVVSVEMQLGKCGKFDPRKCWAGDEATETWNCLCGKSQSQTSTTTAPRATSTGFWALLGTPPPWQPLPGLGNPFRGFFFSIISNINLPWHNLRSLWKAQVFPGRCWALAGLWRGQEWFMNWRIFKFEPKLLLLGGNRFCECGVGISIPGSSAVSKSWDLLPTQPGKSFPSGQTSCKSHCKHGIYFSYPGTRERPQNSNTQSSPPRSTSSSSSVCSPPSGQRSFFGLTFKFMTHKPLNFCRVLWQHRETEKYKSHHSG